MEPNIIPAWCLSLRRASAMARELEALHPHVVARVLYSFGTGGYTICVASPDAGQDEVALLSERAFEVFWVMRADTWRRLPMPHDSKRQQQRRMSLMEISRLRAQDEEDEE